MLSIGNTLHYGEKRQTSLQCKCGHRQFWHATVSRTAKVSIFSIVPLPDKTILKCSKCQREYQPQLQHKHGFSPLTLANRLTQFSGWPILIVIGMLVMSFYRSIAPDDSLYRRAPKIGDIYFVDFHKMTKNEKYASHPYRIAKLVSLSEDALELKVSSWSHSKKWGVLTDFSTQMYAYKSNYMANTITLNPCALHYSDEVFSIRRKTTLVDVEKTQKRTEFQKRFADLPFL